MFNVVKNIVEVTIEQTKNWGLHVLFVMLMISIVIDIIG